MFKNSLVKSYIIQYIIKQNRLLYEKMDLPILLSLTSIIGLSFFLSKVTKISFAYLPLVTFAALSTIGFFMLGFGYFGIYKVLVCILGNILLVYLILQEIFKVRSFRVVISNNLYPIIFLVLSLLLLIWLKETKLYGWDEFFWGQFSKFVHANNTFWDSNSAVLISHAHYPPGPAITQNIFMPFGPFNEGAIYYANIFPFFCILLLISKIVSDAKANILLKIIKILISLFAFTWLYFYFGFSGEKYASYGKIDHTMGVVFSAGVLMLINSKLKGKELLLVFPIISLLCLYKSSGIILGIILITILLVKEHNLIKNQFLNFREAYLPILILFFSFAFFLSPYFLWGQYIEKSGISNSNIDSITYDDLYSAFISRNEDRYVNTWSNFFNYINSKPINDFPLQKENNWGIFGSLTLVTWITIYILISLINIKIQQERKRFKLNQFIQLSVLLIGSFLWLGFHLVIWLLIFSEYEGIVLSSYERYISTYLIAIITPSIIDLIKNIKQIKILTIFIGILMILFNALYPLIELLILPPRYYPDIKKSEMSEIVKKFKQKHSKSYKVYFIQQNASGYEAMLFRYEMSPENKVPTWAWSLGNPYNEMDIWTSNISIEELGLILRKYDYIYLYNIDEQFLNKYWELFGFSQNVHDFSLWSISSDNQVLLNYEEDLQYDNN